MSDLVQIGDVPSFGSWWAFMRLSADTGLCYLLRWNDARNTNELVGVFPMASMPVPLFLLCEGALNCLARLSLSLACPTPVEPAESCYGGMPVIWKHNVGGGSLARFDVAAVNGPAGSLASALRAQMRFLSHHNFTEKEQASGAESPEGSAQPLLL